MLERMGWSKGKGLGVNEDGEQNFIRVSHKSDQKGMGYQDRDDQWTGHENQFNTLLESLNNSQNPSEDEIAIDDQLTLRTGFGFDINDKKSKKFKSIKSKLSGKSLEELSKESSVRVHYRKFTRGKDISKYSEKDLANIFGKKCINGDIVEKTVDELAKEQTDNGAECNYGITTIETGTSVQDYFKMKKRKKELCHDGTMTECTANMDECKKKRRKKDKRTKLEEFATESIETQSSNETKNPDNKKKKKKSKKGSTVENQRPVAMETIAVSKEDNDCEIVSIKLKKKIRKSKKNENTIENQCKGIGTTSKTNIGVADGIGTKSKKKKCDKKRSNEAITIDTISEEVNTTGSKPINNNQFIEGLLGLLANHSPHSSTALKQSNAEHNDTQTTKSNSTYIPQSNIAMDSVFEINRYHAEMFRFVDLDGFPHANLSELNGYGYSRDFELKISEKSRDQTKINDLWDCALVTKYGTEAIQVKKVKKSKQYSIRKLKKKNLFREL